MPFSEPRENSSCLKQEVSHTFPFAVTASNNSSAAVTWGENTAIITALALGLRMDWCSNTIQRTSTAVAIKGNHLQRDEHLGAELVWWKERSRERAIYSSTMWRELSQLSGSAGFFDDFKFSVKHGQNRQSFRSFREKHVHNLSDTSFSSWRPEERTAQHLQH